MARSRAVQQSWIDGFGVKASTKAPSMKPPHELMGIGERKDEQMPVRRQRRSCCIEEFTRVGLVREDPGRQDDIELIGRTCSIDGVARYEVGAVVRKLALSSMEHAGRPVHADVTVDLYARGSESIEIAPGAAPQVEHSQRALRHQAQPFVKRTESVTAEEALPRGCSLVVAVDEARFVQPGDVDVLWTLGADG